MKDAHKLAAYSIVYEVEKAAAKKERKLRRRHNQVLGGTSGNADMGLPPTQANEQGDLIVVIEDDDDVFVDDGVVVGDTRDVNPAIIHAIHEERAKACLLHVAPRGELHLHPPPPVRCTG